MDLSSLSLDALAAVVLGVPSLLLFFVGLAVLQNVAGNVSKMIAFAQSNDPSCDLHQIEDWKQMSHQLHYHSSSSV